MSNNNPELPRFLPYPTGNIDGLTSPDSMGALIDVDFQWWFYVGLLTDRSKQQHSFELSFITIESHFLPPLLKEKLAIVDFDFTFEKGGASFHASSISGPESLGGYLEGLQNFLGWLDVSAASNCFKLGLSPFLPGDRDGPRADVNYIPADSNPTPSTYAGYVGQPGACYDIKATGRSFLTKYTSGDAAPPALYSYEVVLKLVDERGLVPEGMGGYVGIDTSKHESDPSRNMSVEYALPRLRVKSWSVTLSPNQSTSGDAYEFRDNSGSDFLWLDRQALHPEPSAFKSAHPAEAVNPATRVNKTVGLARVIAFAIQFEAADWAKKHVKMLELIKKNILERQGTKSSKQLYCGCWLALTLANGPYEDISVVFVAFWNRARKIGNYDTERKKDAGGGFMNLYLGLLKRGGFYDTASAYVLTDLLETDKEADAPPFPYRINFTEQFTKIGNLPDPERWAKTIEVTVKGGTQARYALAAYAKRAGRAEPQTIDQDVVFTLDTVSPYTVTTLFGSSFYEGAAIVTDGAHQFSGSAWVEQMVGEPQE